MNKIIHRVVLMVCLLLPAFCYPLHSQPLNQTIFQGSVSNAETGDPIQNVQVYLSGTTSGTATGADGTFMFSTGLSGNQQLVFSFIGYRTETETVDLSSRQLLEFDVVLQPVTLQLEGLEVTASEDEEWRREYEIFRDRYIGTSVYALGTEIQNPWVIEFSRDSDNNLEATTIEPLVIINNALGYRIYGDQLHFLWDINGNAGYFNLLTRYEELTPENEEQSKRWELNRMSSYLGSMRHFLRSLYNNRLEDEHFVIRRRPEGRKINLVELNEGELRLRFIEADLNPVTYADTYKGFRLRPIDNGIVYVSYEIGGAVNKRSRLRTLNENDEFFVSESGELMSNVSLAVSGSWGGQRISDFLPYDYLPPTRAGSESVNNDVSTVNSDSDNPDSTSQ